MPERRSSTSGGTGTVRRSRNASRLANEKLLLSLISEEPSLYRRMGPYVSEQDFEEGTVRLAAARLFDMASKGGNVEVSLIIAMFDTEEEQKEAAGLFQENTENYRDNTKAAMELALNVKKAAVEELGFMAEEDPALLFRLIDEKKKLEVFSKNIMDI